MKKLPASEGRPMFRKIAALAVAVLALAGCGAKAPADKVTYVADDDPRMNAAIAKARSTIGDFTAALTSPGSSQSEFAVKMAFNDGAHIEHMWLSPVTVDGANFVGIVNNDPERVTNVKLGQRVTVATTEVSDWMYVDNGKLVGGETLRVLRDSLSPDERADFDKSVPFVVE
jgi:uncharacterized protein YegJ (DUF2314 family)